MVIATEILKIALPLLSVENTEVEPVTFLKAFGTHKHTTIDSPAFYLDRTWVL